MDTFGKIKQTQLLYTQDGDSTPTYPPFIKYIITASTLAISMFINTYSWKWLLPAHARNVASPCEPSPMT